MKTSLTQPLHNLLFLAFTPGCNARHATFTQPIKVYIQENSAISDYHKPVKLVIKTPTKEDLARIALRAMAKNCHLKRLQPLPTQTLFASREAMLAENVPHVMPKKGILR